MRTKHLVAILVLLALAVPALPAHAGGVVSVCDETHLGAALAGGGAVTFTCSGTITLTTEITITADTSIDGTGQTVTISGYHVVRVFAINAGVTFNLNALTIANGIANYGGGIANSGGTVIVSNSTFSGNSTTFGGGGGIANSGGTVIVSNSTFFDNRADSGGGITNYDGILRVSNSTFYGNEAGWGGGIANSEGMLRVSDSTFYGNNAYYFGGGINSSNGMMVVSNSTFSGNSAGIFGGAIISNSGGAATVSNSTFFGNRADSDGGGISNSFGTLTLKNTIVANSPVGSNCSRYGSITDGGGNLSYPDTTCPGINADPLLGPLQDNGGRTKTMALGPGSAAIDEGIDSSCAAPPVNNLDQRGIRRPIGLACDIGAVEQTPYRKMWLPAVKSQ